MERDGVAPMAGFPLRSNKRRRIQISILSSRCMKENIPMRGFNRDQILFVLLVGAAIAGMILYRECHVF